MLPDDNEVRAQKALLRDALPTAVREEAEPLTGAVRDYNSLLGLVGDARVVLLGEASHGTHEFYKERAQITKRLILEKGFNAVAVEADWPDSCRINRFVRGRNDDTEASEALGGFARFPQWMWRNADVLDFIGWLRSHNDAQFSEAAKIGFYGLDLYSLQSSIEAVISYLDKEDPEAARRARERYGCFDQFGNDVRSYGLSTGLGISSPCTQGVLRQLTEMRLHAAHYMLHDGRVPADDFYCAEQNALVVKNAEHYYRTLFHGDTSSWNLRDSHMMETLVSLVAHLDHYQHPAKVVVWAHNSHLGDARATDMAKRGEYNVGQLVREQFGSEAISIGFTTYTGTVTAASKWDAPAERKTVRPAMSGSYEALFHEVEYDRFWLDFRKHHKATALLRSPRLERAIGVIYRPDSEFVSHYFHASLPDQFDGVLHFDETRAVEPLERTVTHDGELEETFPSGL